MDTKYLQRRGTTWHFVMAIPWALRGQFLSPKGRPRTRVEKALGTSDLREAQRLRWGLVDEWTTRFQQFKGAEVSPLHIEREARRMYDETLAALALDARRRPQKTEDEIESLSHWLGELHMDIEHPSRGDADEDVQIIAGRIGKPIAPDTVLYRTARDAALRARYKAVAGRIDMLQGKTTAPPDVFVRSADAVDPLTLQPAAPKPAPRAPRGGGGWTVSQAAAALVKEKERVKLSPGRLRAIHAAVRLFSDHIGADTPLTSITRLDARVFLERMIALRPTWNRDPTSKTMTLDQIEKRHRARNGEPGLTADTLLVGYISPLKSMFDHAANAGEFEGQNPFSKQGFKAAKGEGRDLRAFSIDELNAMMTAKPFTMDRAELVQPARHTLATAEVWASWIALFTGMRLNEVCRLRKSDLKQERGIRFLGIDEGKTDAGKRRIPVHQTLAALGFVDYVAVLPDGSQLFPALKPNRDGDYGDPVSRWFTQHRRATLGRSAADQTDFHSFRRVVATRLREAEVNEADAAAILGHEYNGAETFGTYGKTVSLERLARIMNRLDYPGLALPAAAK